MARFYRALSQDEKSTEEVTQFYPEDSQTVQYVNVIAADGSQQQFQAQPVVVSSDQLMVVEGQQQVIIDQSQVAYQPPQYVIQDANSIDFQSNRQQQVYYMANTPQSQSIVVEQPQQQPVVLNHQLMQNQLQKVNQQMHQPLSASVIQEKGPTALQQIRNQLKSGQVRQNQSVVGARMQMTPQKVVAQAMSQGVLQQNFQRNKAANDKDDKEEEQEEMLTLPDGQLVNIATYKKIMATPRFAQALQDRMTPSSSNNLQRKTRSTAASKLRQTKPRQLSRMTLNRNSAFMSDDQYDEQKPAPIRQNASPQFQNQLPQQRQPQQISRQPPMQQSQNQYVIQPPRPRETKPTNQRPLSQLPFLHSSQIRNIIENTPISEEYSDSIRMLVLLDNGEQRLITFTLPNEACTIQEILQQVGVPFVPDTTPIQVTEANENGLNYIVAVGNVPGFNLDGSPTEEISQQETEYMQQPQQMQETDSETQSQPDGEAPKQPPASSSPEIPKVVEGQLAVCGNCGYLSEYFNKCTRCKRKLPDNVKAVPAAAANNNGKRMNSGGIDKRFALQKTNGVPRMNLLPRKRPSKPKLLECETVVVSSDDEDDGEKKTPIKNVNEQLLEKLGASVTISPISKEPSIVDIQKTSLAGTKSPEKIPQEQVNSTLVICRTVRIGSYRFVPPEPVRIDSNGVTIKVPHPKSDNTIKTVKIENSEIVKVLISFQKSLPVLFYYLLPSMGATIRTLLDMTQGSDCYFDPLSDMEESHRRITLLPETVSDDCKLTLQKIYAKFMLDELTYKEANDILIKTCPKELSKSVLSYSSVSEIKPILVYPPEGRGRITINTEDYMCLGTDQFLNDVIIDFYLKYLHANLPKEQQDKVHIFSTFFYKRLTTKPMKASRKSQPAELDPNLSAAEKRHTRVKTWTKNVNIFEKDFVVVPINENCHWFLAIICFPNMNGSHTMTGQPIKIEPKQKTKKKKTVPLANTLKEKKVEQQAIMCDDPELSDKDEAEGDDSELDSDDSEEPPMLSVENNSDRPPIKQPCILIFDSLAGASRSRVVATLRDYLTCEYKAKHDVEKIFTKDVIKGACPKVPQQTNFTDCGLYLLQYVEQFFKDPIKDYYIPISHLKTWFEEIIVTKKREDISLLIQDLMKQTGKDLEILPDVVFPTQNGELTERALLEKEDKFMDPEEEDEEMMEDEEDDYSIITTKRFINFGPSNETASAEKVANSPIKPSSESVKSKNDFVEQPVINASLLKPDISELPKQSNKDTLSYLKAKRIIRHKSLNVEGPDSKKLKSETNTST